MAHPSKVPSTLDALRVIGRRTTDPRRHLTTCGTFAMFTVQDDTARAERRFEWWDNNGRPLSGHYPNPLGVRYPNSMATYLRSLHSLTDRQAGEVRRLCADNNPWAAVQYLTDHVHGLAYAKSSFTLAVAGWAPTACLDSHVISKLLPTLTPFLTPSEIKENKAPTHIRRYISACEHLSHNVWDTGDDHAAGQWTWWFKNAVNYTDHGAVVRIIGRG